MITHNIVPKNYYIRIVGELIYGGIHSVFLIILLSIILISLNFRTAIGIGLGVILLSLVKTISHAKWYRTFITQITSSENELIIDYVDKNHPQPPLRFNLKSTKISLSAINLNFERIITFSEGDKRIAQIETGNWTRHLIAQVFMEIKDLKGEKLTYDEQDWIKRLTK